MILQTMIGKLRGWQRYHEVMRELGGLDEHMLADISLSRCDFERIASEAAQVAEEDYAAAHGGKRPLKHAHA